VPEQQSFAPAGALNDGALHQHPGVGTSTGQGSSYQVRTEGRTFQAGKCWVQSLFKESHAKKYAYFLGIHHTEDKMLFLLPDKNV